ncbi:MAG: hypothetical protein WCP74_02285 [Sphingobacteriia bacterium]|jgi:hypothetical protein
MEINRHNYETFFLLWVDGELSSLEEDMVERFITENPDLAEELAALQETKLPLDESIVFTNKESLLKVEYPALSMSSYETYFLLYIDNELSAKDKADVELFVLQHPELQAEFMLLKQSKLTPEPIVFANKEVLYKKEEKEKPVIYMQWRRIAVAAALIGLIFSLWMITPGSSSNQTKQVLASTINANNSTVNTNKRNPVALDNNSQSIDEIQSNKLIAANNSRIGKKQNQTIDFNSGAQENTLANSTVTEKMGSSITEKREEELTASTNATIEPIANNFQVGGNPIKNSLLAQATVTEDEQPNNLIKQAVYRELDTDESNKSLYVGALEINKDKLRGIIRKAGTIFRSKSKQDEDKIVTNK